MANDRVTQLPVEAVWAAEGAARVSGLDVEAVWAAEGAARLTQLVVEAVLPIVQSDLHQLFDMGVVQKDLHQLFDIGAIADLHQLFDIGTFGADLHQLFDIGFREPVADLHQYVDFAGLVTSELRQPFDIEGDIAADLHQLFDVLARPPAGNEVQIISGSGVIAGGTYTLTFDGQTTAPIPAGANAAAVQAALEALSNVAPGDLTVTGGPLDG